MIAAALAYAARGWPVFPCRPRAKTPATEHGFKDASTDPATIRAWWAAIPDANVGIATGEISGVYVLDLDDKPGRSIDEALASLGLPWPETPTVRTGGGGVQFFHAFPKGSGLSISGGRLGVGIDTRGNGGYVVAPPSIHPSGRAYEWMDCEDADLAPVPPSVIAALETQRTKAVDLGTEKLTGGRHDTLMTAAALMRGIGLAPAEIEAALGKMVGRLDLSDGRVITPKEIADIATWCGDKSTGLVNIESVVHGKQAAEALLANFGSAAAELTTDDIGPVDPGAFPKHLLAVPGILAQMTGGIAANSLQQQPLLALMASLVAFGALIGRQVRTRGNVRTNLYAVGLCATGGGKDWARKYIKELFFLAGAEAHLHPERIASDSGLIASVSLKPSAIFLVDEIGADLRKFTHDKAGSHERAILTELLTLYSSASSTYLGKAHADQRARPPLTIHQPCLCLYGVGNPTDFYAALSGRDVSSGLIPRMLVALVDDHDPAMAATYDPPGVAASTVELVRLWAQAAPRSNGFAPDPIVVPETDGARLELARLAALIREEKAAATDDAIRAIWSRLYENVARLALISSCARVGPGDGLRDAVITEDEARWAAAMGVHLTRRLVWMVSRHVADNEVEAAHKRLLRLIEDASGRGLRMTELTRKTQWLDRRKRDELLTSLTEAGQVVLRTVATGGRPARAAFAARFAPAEDATATAMSIP